MARKCQAPRILGACTIHGNGVLPQTELSVGLSLPVEMMRGGKQEVMIGWVRAVVDEPVDVGGFVAPSWNG